MTKISAFGDSVLRGVVIDRETSDDSRIKYTFLQNNFTNICADRLGMEILIDPDAVLFCPSAAVNIVVIPVKSAGDRKQDHK